MDENIQIKISETEAGSTSVSAEKTKTLSIPNAIIANGLIVGLSIIIAAFIFVHGPFGGVSSGGDTGGDSATPQIQKPDVTKLKLNADPFIGNANAKVVIAYWSDYQCPYCKMFETTTFQSIVKNYVS